MTNTTIETFALELENELLPIIDNVKCDKTTECESCQRKYNVACCPMSYADDVRDALRLLRRSIDKANMIVEIEKNGVK